MTPRLGATVAASLIAVGLNFVTPEARQPAPADRVPDEILVKFRPGVTDFQRNGVLTYLQIRDRTFAKNVLSLVQRERRGHGLAAAMFAEEIIRALRATME